MPTRYYRKIKEKLVKGIKIFQKKKKTKSENMVVNDIEIFLKKKDTKSVSIVVNDIEIFLNFFIGYSKLLHSPLLQYVDFIKTYGYFAYKRYIHVG